MRILEILLEGVTTHTSTKIVLPSTGVVLITGANGSGKSTLVEGVSVGAWDVALRKKPVWGKDKAAITLLVEVGNEHLLIKRTRTKNRTSLSFASSKQGQQLGLENAPQFENKTKAQESLEQLIGEHALWRRTHVFSSSDADTFTRATDSDRKRMLELLLGLDRFDAAAVAVAADARAAEREYREAERQQVAKQSAYELAQARLQDAFDRLDECPPAAKAADVAGELADIEEAIEAQEQKAAALRLQERTLDREIRNAEALVWAAKERAEKTGAIKGDCPACGQSVSIDFLRHLRQQAKFADHASKDGIAQKREQLEELRQQQHAPTHEVLRLRDLRATLRERRAAAQQTAQVRAAAEEAVRAAQQAAQSARAGVEGGRVAVEALRAAWANLEAAARVLSLGGVRAQLLGAALSGIEGVANGWLDRLTGGGMTLTLLPYAEKASGGVKDSISLEVEGAGNGHGYLAASGGERRRIDLALMLALAEIAEAASGVGGGTIFCDEVFDALDADGVDAACAVLDEIAKTRCVVVISHSDAIKRRLATAARYEVSGGGVQCVGAHEIA